MTSQVENYSHLSRVWKIFSALSVASSSEKPWRQMKTLIFSQPNNCFHVGDGPTWTAYMRQNISTISSRSISPEESLSYIRNAHLAQLNLFTPSFQHLYENDQGTNHVQNDVRLPQLLCRVTTTAHVGCNHKLLEQLMRTSAALRV